MKLQLQIIKDPYRHFDKQRLRVFGETGGVVGRAQDSFWVLPDPKCYVSNHHCEIRCLGGTFWLRDTSRNGVFLNGASEPLGFGRQAQLKDGDRLKFGRYQIRVTINADGHHDAPSHDGGVVPSGPGSEPTAEPLLVPNMTEFDATDSPVSVDPTVTPIRATETELSAPDWAASTQVFDQAVEPPESTRVVKVDRGALQAAGLLPPQEQERLTANQFRGVKRPVIANAVGKGGVEAVPNGRLVMLTSALPGEGKTFSSINLAISLAREKDLEVLLVDADVAKPNVSNVFAIQEEPGLLDAIADEAVDPESLVLHTDVERLSIMPAGRADLDTATELLASSRMLDIAAQLAASNPRRIVLFDSPPLLLTTEARVLAAVVGQIVLVVRAGETPRAAVLEAIGLFEEDKPIGLLLNQCKVGALGNYYGYGSYGYGYGSYGDQAPPPTK